jgi:hypothetical protein
MSVAEVADFLHRELCYDDAHHPGKCSRYERETPHRDYYYEHARQLWTRLEPEIGAANVLLAVRTVVEVVL